LQAFGWLTKDEIDKLVVIKPLARRGDCMLFPDKDAASEVVRRCQSQAKVQPFC
jgi:hypothetical protein